ncbi:GNAT family N-acetyltransferase [Rhizobiaceae sp. 2RAB30]
MATRAGNAAFRLADAADLGIVAALTEEACAAYLPALGAAPVPVTEDYAPRIAAGEVWLLESAGRTAGLLVIETHDDHSLIFSVAVSPAQQGKGFGIRLLEKAEHVAREAKVSEVRLYTNALMLHNIALYQAYGYSETGRRPNPKRPGWIVVDMVKEMPSG